MPLAERGYEIVKFDLQAGSEFSPAFGTLWAALAMDNINLRPVLPPSAI